MKKIFAIALALVMVLSMASAFAMTCNTNYDWSCATTCAAAVVGERVYYGIKLTVDANLNKEWYATLKTMTVTQKNLSSAFGSTAEEGTWTADLPSFNFASNDGKGGVYWHVAGATDAAAWTKDADFNNNNVEAKWALKSNVKVCAKLTAVNEFSKADVGGYTVQYKNNTLTFTKKSDKAVVTLDGDDKVKTIEVTLAGKTAVLFVADNGTAFVANNGDLYGYSCNEGAFLKGIIDFFKFGTCMTKKAINANFGWNDEIESCFTWSKNGTAIVNPECKVEIPKTGDASVVAYAVMALVAAAGAMGLKK